MDNELSSSFTSKFGTVDYCVFAAMLLLSGAIGLYTSCMGNKSPEEFLMGNRSFKPFPIAMSLLTSFVSAISLLGFSGEAYSDGCQIFLFIIGVIFGILFARYFFLPVIYPLKLTSVNEYIELRFKSKNLHRLISIMTCFQGTLYMGICLYAPTIALVTVTNLNYLIYIFLLGVVCTVYSSFGGIRAVIWTDVFQLSVMLIGLLTVVIVGCVQNGGLINTLAIAAEGGRMEVFNMDPSPYVRHSFFNALVFGFFFYAYLYGTAQINVQRMCSVKCIEDANRVLVMNIFGMIFIYMLIFLGGLVAYATYAGCDPMALGIIEKKEEIMPHFIIDKMSFIPGLPGMFVATLIGGTMSSLSSVINAVVAMVWQDVCLKFDFFSSASTRFATLTNKIMSLILGCIIIGLAIIASKSDSLIDLAYTISSVIKSPIFGVFIIGFFFPTCNIKGVWAGFFASSAFMGWISIGAQFFYERHDPLLPRRTDHCENFTVDGMFNLTYSSAPGTPGLFNDSYIQNLDSMNITVNETTGENQEYNHPLAALYGISYTLYCVIGPLLCIFVALVVSYLTGNQGAEDTSPKYVTPCVRRFYWSKQELEVFYQMESKGAYNCEDKNQLMKNGQTEYEMLNIPLYKDNN